MIQFWSQTNGLSKPGYRQSKSCSILKFIRLIAVEVAPHAPQGIIALYFLKPLGPFCSDDESFPFFLLPTLFAICEHYGILLRKGHSSIFYYLKWGGKSKILKNKLTCSKILAVAKNTTRHPYRCALAVQATLRVVRYIGYCTLQIQKERKEALWKKT